MLNNRLGSSNLQWIESKVTVESQAACCIEKGSLGRGLSQVRIFSKRKSGRWDTTFAGVLVAILSFSSFVTANAASTDISGRLDRGLVTVGGLEWYTDYDQAYRAARSAKKMLLINFLPDSSKNSQRTAASQKQRQLEETIAANSAMREQLQKVVRVRVQWDVQIQHNGKKVRLLENGAFRHLGGAPGIAIIDLVNKDSSYYGRVVSALPFRSGKFYHWDPKYLSVALSLPPGSITQRTMIWAVRTHPERPASTLGHSDSQLAQAAASHSQHQANLGVQGHHQWESRFHQIRSMVGAGTASEVVAESWPGQNMIDSCIDCVASWRHSSGHWRAVRSRHRLYGYDIRRGRNGIWYGTGIFAN